MRGMNGRKLAYLSPQKLRVRPHKQPTGRMSPSIFTTGEERRRRSRKKKKRKRGNNVA